MKTYRLYKDKFTGLFTDYLEVLVNGEPTGEWVHSTENKEYVNWLAEGNEPLPPDQGQ